MKREDHIEVSKNEMLNSAYIEREIKKASALLQFKNPNCKIIIEEQDDKIIVKAVEKTIEEKKTERDNRNNQATFSNENVLKVKLPEAEGDER